MTTFTVQGQDPPILKVRRCQQHRVHCVSMSLSKKWKPIRNVLIGFDCYNATMLQSSCLHAKDSEKNVNLLKNLKISVFSVACVNAESFRDKLTLKFISSVRYPRQAWVLQHSFAPNIDTSPISDQPRPQQNSCNCTALEGPDSHQTWQIIQFCCSCLRTQEWHSYESWVSSAAWAFSANVSRTNWRVLPPCNRFTFCQATVLHCRNLLVEEETLHNLHTRTYTNTRYSWHQCKILMIQGRSPSYNKWTSEPWIQPNC